jgi:ABC-2 type transport system permease protein
MFWQIMHMEQEKIVGRKPFWIGLILALLPGLLFLIIAFRVGGNTIPVKYVTWPGGIVTMLAYANGYAAGTGYSIYLLAGVVGVALAQEYSWRTMQLWLSRGVSRKLLLTCKFLVAMLASLLVGIAYLLAGCIVSLFLSAQLGNGIAFSWSDLGPALLSMLRTTYGIFPYVGLTFLLVTLFRSPIAIFAVLIYLMGIEPLLSFVLPLLGQNFAAIPHYLPVGLAQEMSNLNYAAWHLPVQVAGGGGFADPLIATICIAVYTLALFALSLWIFNRQDLAN